MDWFLICTLLNLALVVSGANDDSQEALQVCNAFQNYEPNMDLILSRLRTHRSQPLIRGRTGIVNGVPRQLTRHHIIPHSYFVNFAAVAIESGTHRRALVTEYFYSLLENDVNQQLSYTHPLARQPNSQSTYDRTFDFILAMFEWMPGNIFYGPSPQDRSDDPGNRFEEGAGRVVGDPHFQSLKTMHDRMVNFTYLVEYRTEDTFQLIMKDFENTIAIGPFDYNSDDWNVDMVGKYSLKPARGRRFWPAVFVVGGIVGALLGQVIVYSNLSDPVTTPKTCYAYDVYKYLQSKHYFERDDDFVGNKNYNNGRNQLDIAIGTGL